MGWSTNWVIIEEMFQKQKSWNIIFDMDLLHSLVWFRFQNRHFDLKLIHRDCDLIELYVHHPCWLGLSSLALVLDYIEHLDRFEGNCSRLAGTVDFDCNCNTEWAEWPELIGLVGYKLVYNFLQGEFDVKI